MYLKHPVDKRTLLVNRQLDSFIQPILLSAVLNIKNLKTMFAVLYPGYTTPSTCKKVGSVLLKQIYEEERQKSFKVLGCQTVSMSLDGQSDVHHRSFQAKTQNFAGYQVKSNEDGLEDSYLSHIMAKIVLLQYKTAI